MNSRSGIRLLSMPMQNVKCLLWRNSQRQTSNDCSL